MIILGAGGHARVVAEAWLASGGYLEGFRDDDPDLSGTQQLGYPIWSPISGSADSDSSRQAVIAIGSNQARKSLANLGYRWQLVVHPSAIVSPTATLLPGTMVMAGVVIQTGTTVGSHSIINTRASVDHDCRIADFVHVAPGATLCGGVQVGEGALIGAGAVVLPNVKIGAWSIIGAGATVVSDVPEGATVVGTPARLR